MMMKANERQEWQTEGSRLNTPSGKVQCWSATGSMMTAQMGIEDARVLVADGRAFVMTSQAIGMCNPVSAAEQIIDERQDSIVDTALKLVAVAAKLTPEQTAMLRAEFEA